ncbi:MAG: hypothetical protein LCH85_13485 [Chloroflexi bacterium]|nr:hypothetical protein [Chloroflexota bacterium]
MSDFLDYVFSINLLEATQRNIRTLRLKAAKYGIDIPLHIDNEINIEIEKFYSIKSDVTARESEILLLFNNYINSISDQKPIYTFRFTQNNLSIEMDNLLNDIKANRNNYIHINNSNFESYFTELLHYILIAVKQIDMIPIYIDFSSKRIKDINRFIRENIHNLLGVRRKDVFYILERRCNDYDIDFIPKIYFIFCNIDEIQKIKKDNSINKIKNFLSTLYRPCVFIYKDEIKYKSVFNFQKIYNIKDVIQEFIEQEESIVVERDDNF